MVIKSEYLFEKSSNTNYLLDNNCSVKRNLVTKNSFSSLNKFGTPNKAIEEISPYLNGAKLQILSQMTERKVVQKNSKEVTSSFAQACKIYKANSDDFRCIKGKCKKDKISALNKPVDPNIPQTVSDMNDSEYLIRVDNNRRTKQKKRRVTKNLYRPHENKKYEFYNGDLLHCPGMKSNLNSLHDNKVNNCKSLKMKKKRKGRDNIQSSDVWAMLREMNRFQCISSPPLSADSVETIKKKGKFHKNDKGSEFIETCTTEEFSYISSYDVKSKSRSILSQPSSFDRITIIDKTDDLQIKKAIKNSKANVSYPKKSQKCVSKTKDHLKNTVKERRNVNNLSKDFESCDINNGISDIHDDNKSTVFKTCLANESFHGRPKNYESETTVLNDYDIATKDFCFKDKCKKNISIKHSTFHQCGDIMEPIKYCKPNDHLSETSEKSSKAGLKRLCKTTYSEKYKGGGAEISKTFTNNGNEPIWNLQEPQLQKNPRIPIIIPKLTQTEIRRRLASLKFPIVILGKDEISSTFPIVHYEFTQFNGLSNQIWPYMKEWSEEMTYMNRMENSTSTKCKNKSCKKLPNDENVSNDQNTAMQYKTNVKKDLKLRNQTKVDFNTNSIKSQKSKVLDQFKKKMLGFISHKNPKSNAERNNNSQFNRNPVLVNRKYVSKEVKADETDGNKKLDSYKFMEKSNLENSIVIKQSQPAIKYPWSKAKWASDFIDNIIKKMKKGFYYTNNFDEIEPNVNDEIESAIDTTPEQEYIYEEAIEKDTDVARIPGFEDAQNTRPFIIEVKMLTRTRISIHHCLTNVILQFDITIPSGLETIPSLSLSSFASEMAPEDKTMLYKCKNRIPNAVLPAQLCSILPKLIGQISEEYKTLPKIEQEKNNVPAIYSCKKRLKLPNAVERLIEGVFTTSTPMEETLNNYKRNLRRGSCCYQKDIELLPAIEINYWFVPLFKRINLEKPTSHISAITDIIGTKNSSVNSCRELVPYISPLAKTNSTFSCFNIALHNTDWQKNLLGLTNFTVGVNVGVETSNCVNFYINKSLDGLRRTFNALSSFTIASVNLPLKPISYIKQTNKIERIKPIWMRSGHQIARKTSKRTFHKSQKKCKSMTNMARENFCTPLNKIVNLDDFLQALGCCKQLSTVLQGYSERKILSCILEMKRWINDITQGQALLVLLLASKKDTNNLRRFWPMLLQGIAVNRITTSTELDMEIEVIEKENICVSQNEGISFFSTSNGYKLWDELYWIAKTTASDYQKPFDDSSKKLLKSLLEKRKKLNPSYLRVMARYVGLGLLKPRRY